MKHEIYLAAIGGHLFYNLLLQGRREGTLPIFLASVTLSLRAQCEQTLKTNEYFTNDILTGEVCISVDRPIGGYVP